MNELIITYEGIEYEVHYQYTPEEKESWGYFGGHPPIHEEAEIYHMYCDGVDYVDEMNLEEVEKVVLKQLKDYHDEY